MKDQQSLGIEPRTPVQYIQRIVGANGYLVVVAQWQAAQARCPGFDSRRLPAFSLSSIFTSKTPNLSLFTVSQEFQAPSGLHNLDQAMCEGSVHSSIDAKGQATKSQNTGLP